MDTTASYRSTAATNGATPHGGANGYHHLSNGSTSTKTAAVSQYQAKKQRAPAVMRHEGGGWLTGNFVKLSACAAAGVVFGFAAEKAKVYIPVVIQNQMSFSQFIMLKAFLSATTAGLVSFILLSIFPPTRSLFDKVRSTFAGTVEPKKSIAFVMGGAILGMGMTVSGACPGMVVIQMGAGVKNAFVTLAGCYTGALLYAAVKPLLEPLLMVKGQSSESCVDKKVSVSYFKLAAALATMLSGVAFLADYLVPWTSEVQVSPATVGFFEQKSWSPILAGLIMGSLQLVVAFTVKDSLGGSSSYCTLLSQVRPVRNWFSYLSGFQSGIENWWQVAYWLGALGGAGLSAHLSGTWGQGEGVIPWVGFVGGAMMLFGARMASGCTSGHGLSGMALLSLPAFLAVPSMFAGGMGLAFALNLLH